MTEETATKDALEELLENAAACGTVYGPCDNPVAWLQFLKCCGGWRKLMCDQHRLCYLAEAKRRLLETGLLCCPLCGARSSVPAVKFIPV